MKFVCLTFRKVIFKKRSDKFFFAIWILNYLTQKETSYEVAILRVMSWFLNYSSFKSQNFIFCSFQLTSYKNFNLRIFCHSFYPFLRVYFFFFFRKLIYQRFFSFPHNSQKCISCFRFIFYLSIFTWIFPHFSLLFSI